MGLKLLEEKVMGWLILLKLEKVSDVELLEVVGMR
jgi:hypothetical protein